MTTKYNVEDYVYIIKESRGAKYIDKCKIYRIEIKSKFSKSIYYNIQSVNGKDCHEFSEEELYGSFEEVKQYLINMKIEELNNLKNMGEVENND